MKAEAASQARPERTDAVSGKFAEGCSVQKEARCLDRGSRKLGWFGCLLGWETMETTVGDWQVSAQTEPLRANGLSMTLAGG